MAARTLPTMPSWSTGQELTSSLMNEITAYAQFWSSPPMFRMYQANAQSIANTTFTQIMCDTAQWDTDSGRSAVSPYSYTVPFAGRWELSGIAGFASNGTGARYALFYQNGSAVTTTQVDEESVSAAGSTSDIAMVTCTVACNVGDVLALYGYQNSGGALNSDAGHCAFEGRLVSLASP